MKVVKLRKNQKLFKQGFTHAFRFPRWEKGAGAVVAALNRIYNNRQWRGKYWAWQINDGKWRRDPATDKWRFYIYIAVRNEAVVTQVLLTL